MTGTLPLFNDFIKHAVNSNGFVVEIGVHAGTGSTIAFQDALKNHQAPLHVGVDWDPSNLKDENHPKTSFWHYVVGDSRDSGTLAKVQTIAEGRRPGVIFIDTDHNYSQMQAELALWGPYATNETVWLGHDSWMFGVFNADMMRAVEEYATANGWNYEPDFRKDSHGLWRLTK